MKLEEAKRIFPNSDAMKYLQVAHGGTDKEYYIDTRTRSDKNFNHYVHPLLSNSFIYAYVCPNCGELHIRNKRYSPYKPVYYEDFQIPEDEISAEDILEFKDDDTGIKPNMIHMVDKVGMTIYHFNAGAEALITELRTMALRSNLNLYNILLG